MKKVIFWTIGIVLYFSTLAFFYHVLGIDVIDLGIWGGFFGLMFYLWLKDKDDAKIEGSEKQIYDRIMYLDSIEEKIQYVEKLHKARVLGSEKVLVFLNKDLAKTLKKTR